MIFVGHQTNRKTIPKDLCANNSISVDLHERRISRCTFERRCERGFFAGTFTHAPNMEILNANHFSVITFHFIGISFRREQRQPCKFTQWKIVSSFSLFANGTYAISSVIFFQKHCRRLLWQYLNKLNPHDCTLHTHTLTSNGMCFCFLQRFFSEKRYGIWLFKSDILKVLWMNECVGKHVTTPSRVC